jgi:two-component system sensor histidine kinase DesK
VSLRQGWVVRRMQQAAWVRGRVGEERSRAAALLVWLGFILVPPVTAVAERGASAGHWLAVTAAVAFSAIYVSLVMIWFDPGRRRTAYLLAGSLLAIAITLTIADRAGWGFLFSYCAACAALAAPAGYGFTAVLAITAVAVGSELAAGGSGGAAAGYGASTVGVGLLLVLMRDLRVRNQELQEARAELALTAVARERERFARDLHDLLGHSLSVIALKAELAGRLLPERPEQAARELGEVEGVARAALVEVRQAVSGYRRPTLEGELTGARMALSAAGIEAVVDRDAAVVAFDPEVEAVLAWAVREGATNVIRHSGAGRCTVTITAGLSAAEVEVVDDGPGAASVNGSGAGSGADPGAGSGADPGAGGNGIDGLRERAEAMRGRIEAGRLPGGGFRLAVSVPVGGP